VAGVAGAAFCTVVNGFAQDGVEAVGGGLVDAFEEVSVGVERDLDRGVTEAELDDFGVFSLGDEDGCVGVAEVVEPERLTYRCLHSWDQVRLRKFVRLKECLIHPAMCVRPQVEEESTHQNDRHEAHEDIEARWVVRTSNSTDATYRSDRGILPARQPSALLGDACGCGWLPQGSPHAEGGDDQRDPDLGEVEYGFDLDTVGTDPYHRHRPPLRCSSTSAAAAAVTFDSVAAAEAEPAGTFPGDRGDDQVFADTLGRREHRPRRRLTKDGGQGIDGSGRCSIDDVLDGVLCHSRILQISAVATNTAAAASLVTMTWSRIGMSSTSAPVTSTRTGRR